MIRLFRSDIQGRDFYKLMGPHFASLDIAKELERQVYNKPNTNWLIAVNRFEAIGFVSVHDGSKRYFIDNLYVLPKFRKRGIAEELIEEVCEIHSDKPLHCIACNPYALKIFKKFGFVEVGERGKYKKLEKH